ncbi:MAG TPA: OmpA family protein [Steroidobacteraceae bacterium]|nr:OmpA family protein [Steroidobacteraceae bacterium]
MNLRGTTTGLAVAALAAGAPAWAGPASQDDKGKAEDVGIFTGLAVGAAAAGPLGALIGAGVGGLVGDRYQRQEQTAAQLRSNLGDSEAARSRLAESVAQLNDSLGDSRTRGARLEQTLAAVDEVGMDLSFRTDDAAIRVEDLTPLLKLGALAAAMPDAKLRVAGYADPRGPALYNEALSARRAAAVATALTQAGLPRERLIVEAHGCAESSSAAGDLDAYALDRRVTVRLERAALPAPVKVASAGPTPGVER